ncbi:MAG TPA: hypothetical protein VHV10_20150 [Ktedonobacteraceae bacterium]|jgi:hypothetical protein|nr:hypothetical protein [Ktedonobacteraceae bacterium]
MPTRRPSQPRHEEQKTLTLWGHRGWHNPDTRDYNTGSINRGHIHLNKAIQDIANQVTVHSVSHSSIVIPLEGSNVQLLYMSATILYSGDWDTSDGTVFEVQM